MNDSMRANFVSALFVGEYANDRLLVYDIFRRFGWRLFEAGDRRRAMQCLRHYTVQVVVAESEVPGWNWKSLLSDLHNLARPPQLIVASRTADDSLWAEVLNFGAFDLLAQPFVRDEVERVIAGARRLFDVERRNVGREPLIAEAGAA